MFCKKCGKLIEDGAKFCGNCGTPVELVNNPIQSAVNNSIGGNNNIQQTANPISNTYQETKIDYNAQNMNNYNNQQNYDNIVNPSMKKYAIASVAIPAVAILVYWFIGLTIYIAILLAGLGYNFSNKGKLYNKTLSTIGYILNTILIIMAIFVGIGMLIEKLA